MKTKWKAFWLLISGGSTTMGVYILGLPIHNNYLVEARNPLLVGLILLCIGISVFFYNCEQLEKANTEGTK